jgi:hypothetical protein
MQFNPDLGQGRSQGGVPIFSALKGVVAQAADGLNFQATGMHLPSTPGEQKESDLGISRVL